MKQILLLLTILVLYSCKPDDIYYLLSDEAKSFVNYEVGQTFQLENQATEDILNFTITEIETETIRLGNGPGQMVFLGVPADKFYERTRVKFTSENDCSGSIFVRAQDTIDFDIHIGFTDCNTGKSVNANGVPEFIGNYNLDGITYTNVYIISGFQHELYYSIDIGFVEIIAFDDSEDSFKLIP